MRWERGRSGLLLPRRPGLCSLFGATHLCGFGAGGDTNVQPALDAASKDSDVTLSDNNRTWSMGNATGAARSTTFVNAVKRYVEMTPTSWSSSNRLRFGIANSSWDPASGTSMLDDANSWGIQGDGTKKHNNSSSAYGSAISSDGTLMLAFDGASLWIGFDGTWFNSGDPAAGTGAAYTGLSGDFYLGVGRQSTTTGTKGGTLKLIADYTYSPPAGFTKGW